MDDIQMIEKERNEGLANFKQLQMIFLKKAYASFALFLFINSLLWFGIFEIREGYIVLGVVFLLGILVYSLFSLYSCLSIKNTMVEFESNCNKAISGVIKNDKCSTKTEKKTG